MMLTLAGKHLLIIPIYFVFGSDIEMDTTIHSPTKYQIMIQEYWDASQLRLDESKNTNEGRLKI